MHEHFNKAIIHSYHGLLLVGQPATIKVDVKMPENYPVDLYYLMDLSGSMVEDLKKFPSLGQQIGMKQIDTGLHLLSAMVIVKSAYESGRSLTQFL